MSKTLRILITGAARGIGLATARQVFEANTLGALRIIQAVLPGWRQRGSGVIVNVSSVGGRVSAPLESAYNASKFALEAFTESLHIEVRHFGIRCVIIEPGNTASGIKAIERHEGPADSAAPDASAKAPIPATSIAPGSKN